ncbi:hypothetical protein [Intestinimonas sp. HCP28S3_D6]|uniref:hypothetical protein n=1 Tax=Intestinimonas sp. HCP28S3_D6 TaxID=3438942 RepID=UPI003F8C6361
MDERTAAHELYGYKVALRDLGLLDREDCYVLPDTFGEERPRREKRATFENLHPELKRHRETAQVYALGLALAEDCPDNDCRLYGDIPQMSGSMANYTFGDTPSADANKLQWVKIKDGDKTRLICDRVILVSVSWDDLNGQGYVTGKTITIDGTKYKCRLLTGGSNRRNNDWYAGGTPTNNEWDRFITREEVITGLPAPVSSDLDTNLNTTDHNSTHKRTNSAPAISGQDEDLGQQTGSFAEKYTVTDVEGDNVVVTEFVDDKQIRSYQATLGQEETIELSRENWLVLANGDHQLRVEAVDGNFATSVRVWNFSKKETVIAFQFAQPEETDTRATKILITPTWHIEGSVAKVEACNNAFDASPAWEDITAQVAINRVYNFLNQSKTAEKWGVNVRFTIEKNEGYEGEVSISGFGGAYE